MTYYEGLTPPDILERLQEPIVSGGAKNISAERVIMDRKAAFNAITGLMKDLAAERERCAKIAEAAAERAFGQEEALDLLEIAVKIRMGK